MSDSYRIRMLALADQLHAQGIGRYTAAPPLYRLAWLLGLKVRPPLYQSFAASALFLGTYFGLAYGIGHWIIDWSFGDASFTKTLFTSLFSGTFFGLTMAAVSRFQARKLRLPPFPDQMRDGVPC